MKKKNEVEKKPKNSAEDVKLSRVFYHYWKFAREYKWQYFLMTLFYFIGNILWWTLVPLVYKDIFNLLPETKNNPDSFYQIWYLFAQILILVLIANILFRIADYLVAKHQSLSWKEIDIKIFQKITQYSMNFFESTFVGSIINKMTNFSGNFVSLMDNIIFSLLYSVSQIGAILVILFSLMPSIAIIFLSWIIFYILVSIWFTKKFLIYDLEFSEASSKQTGILSDLITNISTLKLFPNKKDSFNFYKKIANETEKKRFRSWNFSNKLWLTNGILFFVLEISVMSKAFILFKNNHIGVGDVVLIQSYYFAFFNVLWNISKVFKRLIMDISKSKEMVAILDQPIEVQDIKNAKKLKVEKGEIEFQDTTFSYPNQKENVFHKFNLKIPAGQTVGLVGTSGAGKTTITKLLLRFSNLNSGKILIDGQDISQVTQDSLRSSIAYVPQEPVLFHRSIYENIAYANPEASKEEVLEASQKAHVDEFVQTLENGYDTMVGERGVKLSGGQKQRVAVARAFLKNAPILVLDEATSALDSVSEEFIQDALFKLMKNKTVIVVAHRLSTIQRLDRILVIEDGIIEEDGNHETLLQQKGQYAEFWRRQSGR